MQPLVSILIPCHNAVRYVGAALQSALEQTWRELEIIVVNDACTDGSERVVLQYESENLRVLTPEHPLRSAAKSRNFAYQHSNGEYVKFFDADDLMHPGMIESQIKRMQNSAVDVASSGWGRFYRDDVTTFKLNPQSVWRDMDARDWLVEAWNDAQPMMQPGMFLIPRKLIEQTGGWNEELTLIDDFEFFARVLSSAQYVRFSTDVPLMYRSGLPNSLSGRTSDSAIESAFQSVMRGTEHLLRERADAKAKRACANVLQAFIYDYYPRRADLRKRVATRVKELGGSDCPPVGSPKFELVRKLAGWKIARRLQRLVSAAK